MTAETQIVLPTLEVAERIVAGTPPAGWIPLDQTRLLIIVGVTGVGKSTTLARMDAQGARLHPLPERRILTDKLIIPAVQSALGEPVVSIGDRTLRFGYTRRFREWFPGGMAQALQLISVDPMLGETPLLFDGLRGEEEIHWALDALPRARFVMLDAPDVVRVLRLVGRNDSFDRTTATAVGASAVTLGDLFFDEVGVLFNEEEVAHLRQLIVEGAISADEVRAKARIVSEERRNYDPAATRNALESAGSDRALVIDTTAYDSSAVAEMILAACKQWFG